MNPIYHATSITYNALNLPETITFTNGSTVTYQYAADGTRLCESTYEKKEQGLGATLNPEQAASLLSTDLNPKSPVTPIDPITPIEPGEELAMVNHTYYAGSYEFNHTAKPQRLLLGGGYLTLSDNIYHHYITDYQGNVVLVINTGDRSIEQQTGYYPYGMPRGDAVGADVQPNKYSGKRLQTFAGLDTYDFHARQLPIGIPRFDRPDPLSEKRTPIGRYVYCSGDPINEIDPSGEDEYIFNQYGMLIDHIINKDYDYIHIQKDPNDTEYTSLKLPVGTLKCLNGKAGIHERLETEAGDIYSLSVITGQDRAIEIFEFMSDNTKVEWSLAITGLDKTNAQCYLTTSFSSLKDAGSTAIINNIILKQRNLTIHIHTHQSYQPFPSGILPLDSGDATFAKSVDSFLGYRPIYMIYCVPSKSYIHYSAKSRDYDSGYAPMWFLNNGAYKRKAEELKKLNLIKE